MLNTYKFLNWNMFYFSLKSIRDFGGKGNSQLAELELPGWAKPR
jgi:hypothetical protein